MFQADLSDFFVVVPVSNTARFRRRYELARHFIRRLTESGVNFLIVECAFGDRPFELNVPSEAGHVGAVGQLLQLRTVEEFWHKENLINLGIQHGLRIWPGKKYAAWIDADCAPVGRTFREWFEETWHELQHSRFVQMWEWLQPLDYYYAPLGAPNPSFVSNYVKYGTPYPRASGSTYPAQWGSPGLAWAAEISALSEIGFLGDVAVAGAGDWYLAHSLISDLPQPDMAEYTADYRNYWLQRQALCEKWIRRDVGYVRGTFTHFFHGEIAFRGYNWRERILTEGKFSPQTDLKRDAQGMWQLETFEPRQIWIRDRLRAYFRTRNEDSIDLLNQTQNRSLK